MDDLSEEEVDQISKVMGEEAEPEAQAKAAAEPEVAVAVEEPPPPTSKVQGDYEAPSGSSIARAQFMQLEELAEAADLPPSEMNRMHDINVKVEAVLGRAKLSLEEILRLHPGTVLELNRLAGEPVDIIANDQLIARAEVVVVDDNFGIKILEIVGSQTDLGGTQK